MHVFPLFAGPRGAGPHGLDKAVGSKVAIRLDVNNDFMATLISEMKFFEIY